MNVAATALRASAARPRQSARETRETEVSMTRADRARSQRRTALTLKSTDHDWYLVDPGNPSGPQMAALWGDPRVGAYGALLRKKSLSETYEPAAGNDVHQLTVRSVYGGGVAAGDRQVGFAAEHARVGR
jgi:hypothetical protein